MYFEFSHLLPHMLQDIFHLAISRYIEQPEKKDLLLHLLQWMPGQGYAVDSTTSDMILKNSHFFDQSIAELMYKHHTVLKTNKLRREEQRTNMSS